MREYILRRLVLFIPTAFGVSVLIFLMLRVIPGDYAATLVLGGRTGGVFDRGKIEEVRHKLGLDRPLYVQYGTWIKDLFGPSLGGKSLVTSRPVSRDFLPAIQVSAEVALLAIILAMVIAVPGGIIAAVAQDKVPDYILRSLSMAFQAMPSFWLGMIIILILVRSFDWIPPLGFTGFFENPWKNIQQVFFPALAVGARGSADMLRMTRSAVLEVVREDYIRTAWAKGLAARTVLYIHVLRNALLPVVTLAGFEIVFLLGGEVIIEQVFNLPGVGKMFVRAATLRDYPTIQAIIMFVAVVVLVANLTVDLLYAWLDPRIRYT
ncbi:MAG: ABC transporter permease [Dehalococcoidia bacterium]